MQTTIFGQVLCTLRLGAGPITQEMLVFLGNLDLLVLEGCFVKQDITGLVGMLMDGLLVVLFKNLLARNTNKLADMAEFVTSSALNTEFVAKRFAFELRE
jgi:hypothetical protein